MSEEKKEAREALLGELESIKSLLSEEEWEHIPVLDDPVTGPVPAVDLATPAVQTNEELFDDDQPGAAEDLAGVDIPVLDEVYPLTDSIPLSASEPVMVPPETGTPAMGAPAPGTAGQPPRPFAPRTAEIEAQDLRQRLTSKRRLVERRGENPFLPQHIRDRLHTRRALVDIINDSPTSPPNAAWPAASSTEPPSAEALPKVLSQEKLNRLIDGLVAIYLPQIEADLRARLREALQEDSSSDQ